jgi:ferredoxin-type protein NapH
MKELVNSIAVLLGKTPTKPTLEEISAKARAVHDGQAEKLTRELHLHIQAERVKKAAGAKKWRRRRWSTLIAVNLLFVLSYWLDIQLVEGSLTGSRFVGFHMADLNASLQVMLAYKQILINLLIGVVTILLIWWLLGGRTFCSWVCPYHLLGEWAEMLHLKLVKRKRIKNHAFDRRARTWLWLTFALLAFVMGYTVYETISPTGILSRALIYGPSLALAWVLALLVFEILYSRRAWCRYACPIGLTYGLVGSVSPLKVTHNVGKCFNDGACRQVCLVPHVLDSTIKGRAKTVNTDLGADCTRCGMCLDVCPTDALSFNFKGLGKLK